MRGTAGVVGGRSPRDAENKRQRAGTGKDCAVAPVGCWPARSGLRLSAPPPARSCVPAWWCVYGRGSGIVGDQRGGTGKVGWSRCGKAQPHPRSPGRPLVCRARGDVSHEHDLDAVPRAAAAVDGTPGGRGAGRRATHSLCLRALPARGARPADGALRAHPTRPLQPHARLVLDRPQGGTRAWPVRLRVGLNHLTLGWPSIGSGPTGLLWGAAGPTALWIPPQSPAQGGGHEKSSPSSPRPLPYTQASAIIPPRKPEPHFVPFPALSSPPNSPIPTACR